MHFIVRFTETLHLFQLQEPNTGSPGEREGVMREKGGGNFLLSSCISLHCVLFPLFAFKLLIAGDFIHSSRWEIHLSAPPPASFPSYSPPREACSEAKLDPNLKSAHSIPSCPSTASLPNLRKVGSLPMQTCSWHATAWRRSEACNPKSCHLSNSSMQGFSRRPMPAAI